METNGQNKSVKNTPSCEIRIDKEGVWYFRGVEMFRKDIVNLFYQNLTMDDEGRYLIEMEKERCYLEVEDTPFIVKAVYPVNFGTDGPDGLDLHLIDDTIEKLDPDTLRVGKDHVLYCSIREGRFEARFSRASYYQIAEYFRFDDVKDHYYLVLNERSYLVDVHRTGNNEDGG